MNNVTVPTAAFKAMEAKLDVTMDDVVSAFVAQYETNLFDRKAELTADIKMFEKNLAEIEDAARDSVPDDEYEGAIDQFNLVASVVRKTVNFSDGKVQFEIIIKENTKTSGYSDAIRLRREKKLATKFVKQHNKVVDELMKLRGEVAEVLENLKAINRKERQVRGRIAMRKLEDSGYANLMDDAELIKLVQL